MSTAIEQAPEPRALYKCICGKEFLGAAAASEWISHTVPCCTVMLARERLSRDLEATRVRKLRIEDALRRAFDDAIDGLGFVSTIEAIANATEETGEQDEVNADCWAERAATLFNASEVGEEQQ